VGISFFSGHANDSVLGIYSKTDKDNSGPLGTSYPNPNRKLSREGIRKTIKNQQQPAMLDPMHTEPKAKSIYNAIFQSSVVKRVFQSTSHLGPIHPNGAWTRQTLGRNCLSALAYLTLPTCRNPPSIAMPKTIAKQIIVQESIMKIKTKIEDVRAPAEEFFCHAEAGRLMVMRHIGDKQQFYIKPPSYALSREPKFLFVVTEGVQRYPRGAKHETCVRQQPSSRLGRRDVRN
jgi:hypothetical protein